MFSTAGIDVAVSREIRIDLWKKLLLVSSWAGLAALARSPMGVMRAEPGTRALIDRSIDEGLAVARATGHDVGPEYKDEMWAFYHAMPDEATASMQRDLMEGRPSEAGGVERCDMPVRRRGRGPDTGALVHVSHPATDGAQGSRWAMTARAARTTRIGLVDLDELTPHHARMKMMALKTLF